MSIYGVMFIIKNGFQANIECIFYRISGRRIRRKNREPWARQNIFLHLKKVELGCE